MTIDERVEARSSEPEGMRLQQITAEKLSHATGVLASYGDRFYPLFPEVVAMFSDLAREPRGLSLPEHFLEKQNTPEGWVGRLPDGRAKLLAPAIEARYVVINGYKPGGDRAGGRYHGHGTNRK